MMVFDSSAIYKLISLGKPFQLYSQHTSSLAFFELGNIVWKNSVLTNTYSKKEAVELINICETVLENMKISYSTSSGIYQIASDCQISFYDASYVCLSKDLKCPLISLDHKLISNIKGTVNALTIEEFIKS